MLYVIAVGQIINKYTCVGAAVITV